MSFVCLLGISLELLPTSVKFTDIDVTHNNCAIKVLTQSNSVVLASGILNISETSIEFALNQLEYEGTWVSVGEKLAAGAEVRIVSQEGSELHNYASATVTSIIPQCADAVTVHLYREKVVLSSSVICEFTTDKYFTVSFAGEGDIHKFKADHFADDMTYTEADNAAVSGRTFIEIINELVRTKSLRVEYSGKVVVTFKTTVVEEEDLAIEKPIKYWVLILVLVAVLLVVLVVVFSIILCKRKRSTKTDFAVRSVELENDDALFGENDRPTNLEKINNVSREFGMKEVLGGPITARRAGLAQRQSETQVINSPVIIGNLGEVVVFDGVE